jgi:YbbR domain-containing protein
MARRDSNFRPGLFLLAVAIAAVLWGMAHGASSIERGYDIPVVFKGLPESLVLIDQSTDLINIRVLGSRAALRDISPTAVEYVIDVSGAKPGPAVYDVELSRIDLPRGSRAVSRSPAHIEVRFEPRGRKSVAVRADLEGQPPEGYELGEVAVEPARVWLVGARSAVMRLTEIVTEVIDVSELSETVEREVRLSLGNGGLVWMEKNEPVKVRLEVRSLAPPEAPAPGAAPQAG